MTQLPLISVIVPVYNVDKYLPRCLNSICKQTYQNLEIIIVDDGSTDNSLAICQKYAKQDKRITLIHQTNGGLSSARNTGMDHMHGEFFTFVDSDDYLAENALEILSALQQASDAPMTWGRFTIVQENETQYIPQPLPTDFFCDNLQKLTPEDLLQLSVLLDEHAAWGKLFKYKEFGNLRFNGFYARSEDFDFFFQVVQKIPFAAYADHSVYYYCTRANSIIQSIDLDNEYKVNMQYQAVYNFCQKQGYSRATEAVKNRWGAFRCVFITKILLYGKGKKHTYFEQELAWLKHNRLTILQNIHMRTGGKMFMIVFSFFPRILLIGCRLPVLKPFLQQLLAQRLSYLA